jgi:uncharacterized protein (DUF2267 family)
MRWNEFVDRVRQYGQYTTIAEAESVIRTVLSSLGGHLEEGDRARLATTLPPEAVDVLTGQVAATRPRTAAEFVRDIALRIDGATEATARWDVSSVLSVVAEVADSAERGLVTRLIGTLPPGYALLFGRAELAPAA